MIIEGLNISNICNQICISVYKLVNPLFQTQTTHIHMDILSFCYCKFAHKNKKHNFIYKLKTHIEW